MKFFVNMPKSVELIVVALALVAVSCAAEEEEQEWFTDHIEAYHFHTYVFQNDPDSVKEALRFRWVFMMNYPIEMAIDFCLDLDQRCTNRSNQVPWPIAPSAQ